MLCLIGVHLVCSKRSYYRLYLIQSGYQLTRSCFSCLCCRGRRTPTGASSENRATCRNPPTAFREKRSDGMDPFTLPSPAPGGPNELKLGGGLRCLQGLCRACWDRGGQRAADMQHNEGTQDPTSCHRAGWHGVSYNENCVGLRVCVCVCICVFLKPSLHIQISTFWISYFSTMFLWFIKVHYETFYGQFLIQKQ